MPSDLVVYHKAESVGQCVLCALELARATAMPYSSRVHTVVETNAYLSAARFVGMSAEERVSVVDTIAAHPEMGEIMPGSGGARKLRVARPGGGKSGGYRVITYFGGADVPVFLLTVFGKNEKANLSQAERNALAMLTKRLADGFRFSRRSL